MSDEDKNSFPFLDAIRNPGSIRNLVAIAKRQADEVAQRAKRFGSSGSVSRPVSGGDGPPLSLTQSIVLMGGVILFLLSIGVALSYKQHVKDKKWEAWVEYRTAQRTLETKKWKEGRARAYEYLQAQRFSPALTRLPDKERRSELARPSFDYSDKWRSYPSKDNDIRFSEQKAEAIHSLAAEIADPRLQYFFSSERDEECRKIVRSFEAHWGALPDSVEGVMLSYWSRRRGAFNRMRHSIRALGTEYAYKDEMTRVYREEFEAKYGQLLESEVAILEGREPLRQSRRTSSISRPAFEMSPKAQALLEEIFRNSKAKQQASK